MSQPKNGNGTRVRRSPVMYEEDQAWVAFYRRCNDPSIAAELVQYLESDPEVKRAHAALYLHCKQALRRHKERQVRAKRIGSAVRLLLKCLFILPWQALQRGWGMTSSVAIECLPDTRPEPAVWRVRHLAEKPGFVPEQPGTAQPAGDGKASATGINATASPSGTKAA